MWGTLQSLWNYWGRLERAESWGSCSSLVLTKKIEAVFKGTPVALRAMPLVWNFSKAPKSEGLSEAPLPVKVLQETDSRFNPRTLIRGVLSHLRRPRGASSAAGPE
jgi:hypothetical protein